MKRFLTVMLILLFTLVSLCSCNHTTQNLNERTNNPTPNPTPAETEHVTVTDQIAESPTIVPEVTDDPTIDDGITPSSYFRFDLLKDGSYEIRPRHSILLLEKVVLPDSYNGKPVTSIGENAFAGYNSIKDIVIPDSIKTIGDFAFYNCSSLEKVDIPQSVKTIGNSAFSGCMNLQSITLPDDLEECGSILTYSYFNNEQIFSKYENAFYLGSNKNPYLYLYKAENDQITEAIINENTRFIGEGAFANCKGITEINIPAGMKSIGSSAFASCTFLQNVDLPDSLTYIAPDAFSNCRNLVYSQYDNGFYLGNKNNPYLMLVSVSIDITSITVNENTRFIASNAFYHGGSWDSNCHAKSVTLPAGINIIGDRTFSNCSIESFTIPEGITSIGSRAFSSCANLTEIYIPDSVTYIGESAFNGCKKLKEIHIPDSVTYIGSHAFADCENLKEIYMPETVEYMDSSFSGCNNLPLTEYDNGLYLRNGNNPYFIFVRVKDLNKPGISINENTKFIAGKAFDGYEALTNLVLPKGIKNIGASAFYGFHGLLSITIPEGITFIGSDAFAGCSRLKEIHIPDSVIKIGEHAFSGCGVLRTIAIPDSVISIGSYAFGNDFAYISFENITITDGFPLFAIRYFEYAIGDYTEKTFFYNGTTEEWAALERIDYPIKNIAECNQFHYIVHCTDGDYDPWFY